MSTNITTASAPDTTVVYSLFAERFTSNYRFQYPIRKEPNEKASYSFKFLPHNVPSATSKTERPFVRLPDCDLFNLPFGTFVVSRNEITFAPSSTDQAPDVVLEGYFFGIVSSWRLEQCGRLTFHGSVVQQNDRAIAVIAAKGNGKSTLAGYLVANGYELLNDDMVAVEQTSASIVQALPGLPQIRNFPGILDRFFPKEVERHPLPYTSKQWVLVDQASGAFGRFCAAPRKLDAIYLLARDAVTDVVATPLSRTEAFSTLMKFSYPYNLLRFLNKTETKARFHELATIAERVPVMSLSIPDALDALPRVLEIINNR